MQTLSQKIKETLKPVLKEPTLDLTVKSIMIDIEIHDKELEIAALRDLFDGTGGNND